jgi:hypothetical protein
MLATSANLRSAILAFRLIQTPVSADFDPAMVNGRFTIRFALQPERLRVGAPDRELSRAASFKASLVSSRHIRVGWLVAATIAMSLGDLYMTLAYLKSVGMDEVNPLARLVISYGCPGALAAWKVLTLGLGMFIIFRLRRTRGGELGAWCCFAMLLALTLHWTDYNHAVAGMTPEVTSLVSSGDPTWITINN